MNREALPPVDGGKSVGSLFQKAVEGKPGVAGKGGIWVRRWGGVAFGGALLVSGVILAVPRLFPSPQREEQAVLPVTTVQVQPVQSYTITRTYTGKVTATRSSELGFERSGTLVWIGVDRGDRVAAGDAIARLDTQNQEAQLQQLVAQKLQAEAVLQELRNGPRREAIAAARAQVGDLQNQLALEKIRRDRRQSLYEEGAISREELDAVDFGRSALRERLAASQSELQELENGTRAEQVTAQEAAVRRLEASIADMEITIAKSTLRAPFAGTIGERRLDEGVVVNGGQAIVRLVEAATPEVEVGVAPEALGALKLGSDQPVQIGQHPYRATVIAIKPEINPTTRTRTVVLRLKGTNLGTIAPEQVTRLGVTQSIPTEGFWLPTTALLPGIRGLWSCYVLTEPTQPNPRSSYPIARRDVEVLHTQGDRVLVRGLLEPGDRVVADGVQRLVPGQLVKPE